MSQISFIEKQLGGTGDYASRGNKGDVITGIKRLIEVQNLFLLLKL